MSEFHSIACSWARIDYSFEAAHASPFQQMLERRYDSSALNGRFLKAVSVESLFPYLW